MIYLFILIFILLFIIYAVHELLNKYIYVTLSGYLEQFGLLACKVGNPDNILID